MPKILVGMAAQAMISSILAAAGLITPSVGQQALAAVIMGIIALTVAMANRK